MKIIIFISLMLTVISGALLFSIKHEVLLLENSSKILSAHISSIREEIVVLNSELSFLTNPKRIDMLAQRYLPNASSLKPEQLIPTPVKYEK